MATQGPRPWTVLPHDPLEQLDEHLWVVEGALQRGPIRRRMSVVRLSDGQLAFHNAVPLREEAMRTLERTGTPAFLLVPNGLHRLDLHAWKERYPALAVLTPPAVRARVERVVPVSGSLADLPPDPRLRAETLAGSRWQEAAVVYRHAGRVALLFGDTVMNLAHLPGPAGLVFRLVGSTGGPRVTPLTRVLSVSSRGALAAHLERLAATPGLSWVVPSHGELVRDGAAEALRAVARRLAG